MSLTPFLMFTGQAEEAMELYVATFPDAEILQVVLSEPSTEGEGSTVARATFRIGELVIRCIDSPDVHGFGFTPSVSFFFDCADAAELDRIFDRLVDGGTVLMPVGEYPFAARFAWLNDRFGVSWQLSAG